MIPLVRTSPPRITGLKHRLHASTTCLHTTDPLADLFSTCETDTDPCELKGFRVFEIGEIGDGR